PALERPYAWRTDLPARPDTHHAGFGVAAANGCRRLALRRNAWLYICRRRIERRRGPLQLPAGDHPALSRQALIFNRADRESAASTESATPRAPQRRTARPQSRFP